MAYAQHAAMASVLIVHQEAAILVEAHVLLATIIKIQ
jgi:hypothetical protein